MSDPRDALDAIGLLPDTEIDIADAALQLARVAAPGADWDHDRGSWEQVNGTWRHTDHHGRHHDHDDRSTIFEPRHPRQARHWNDDLQRCNPSHCWRGYEGDSRGFSHRHGGCGDF